VISPAPCPSPTRWPAIRFGFAVAPPAVVRELVKVKDSYNCDALSLAAAAAALDDQEYLRDTRAKVLTTRARLARGLAALGFRVTRASPISCGRSATTARCGRSSRS